MGRVSIVVFLLVIVAGLVFAQNNGVSERSATESLNAQKFVHTETKLATAVPRGSGAELVRDVRIPRKSELDEWLLLDNIETSFCVPCENHYTLKIDPSLNSM